MLFVLIIHLHNFLFGHEFRFEIWTLNIKSKMQQINIILLMKKKLSLEINFFFSLVRMNLNIE